MENGYYGNSKEYYDKYNTEDLMNTEAYYFEVKDNKIANCVVGDDELSYKDEQRKESGDIYGIQRKEFNQTYAMCDKQGTPVRMPITQRTK